MSRHIVEVKQLRHIYSDGTVALNGVTFKIADAESVGIIGANGAGKSTLLHHLNGYLIPSDGEVRIGEIPVNKSTLREIRHAVGMVFQDPDDQLFMPTVFDDVAFGPLNLGLPAEDVRKRVDTALTQVDALHLRNKPPYHLSGGEKKRVAIATVLSMMPKILLLDEPTNGLDPFMRRELISLLKEFGHSKIIATHDLDMVFEICSRVILLNKGEIVADGKTEDIFRDLNLLASCRLEQPLSLQSCPICGKK